MYSTPNPCLLHCQQPGPSKIHVSTIETENEEFSFDDSVEDNEPCCICGVVEPAALTTQSYIEFVNWAQCHLCEHWVHLKFCVPQRVVRKDTIIVQNINLLSLKL